MFAICLLPPFQATGNPSNEGFGLFVWLKKEKALDQMFRIIALPKVQYLSPISPHLPRMNTPLQHKSPEKCTI